MSEASKERPRCQACGYVMCEEFYKRRINDLAEMAIPNGRFSCCNPSCPGRAPAGDAP